MRKIVETRNSLSNTITDTSTIMRKPLPTYTYIQAKGLRMIVLVSLIVLLSELTIFRMGASLHRHSFSGMIFTLVYKRTAL